MIRLKKETGPKSKIIGSIMEVKHLKETDVTESEATTSKMQRVSSKIST